MDREEIEGLIRKYNQGQCTDREKALLETWYAEWNKDKTLDIPSHFLKEDLLANRKNTLGSVFRAAKTHTLWPRVAAAAMVLIALGLGAYFYFVDHTGPNNLPVVGHGQHPITNNDIDPGGNRAILTLADGRKIMLDEAANGELAEESGIKITKTEDGQLVYEVTDARITDARQPKAGVAGWRASAMRDPASYNTIQTPRGGQYKVILPDSSVVWLNAASSLKYPTRFVGAERRVELTGEAFFSVRHQTSDTSHKTASTQAGGDGNKSKIENLTSKIPFIVATATQEVTVLGTQFNINAYADEPVVKTTLVEGSVAVGVASTSDKSTNQLINQSTNKSTTLRPGQQSILSANSLAVVTVDPESAIAWKNGLFIFDDEPLQDIMRRVARWYDVEVSYEGVDQHRLYWGGVSRYDRVSEVLRKLELTGGVHFKIEGRKIIVMK